MATFVFVGLFMFMSCIGSFGVSVSKSFLGSRSSVSESSADLERDLRHRLVSEEAVSFENRAGVRAFLNDTQELFEGCSAKKSDGWKSDQVSGLDRDEQHSTDEAAVEKAACDKGTITLYKFKSSSATPKISCCPQESLACAGCAHYADGKCKECAGGFVKQDDVCVACLDTAAWVDESGRSCDQLDVKDCSDKPFQGLSSKQACCKCAGGHVTPTSFMYEERVFALGEPVQIRPTPRTAKKYAVDEGCALAAYNLTMDGETGAISYVQGLGVPIEPFEVSCKVSTFQARGVAYTAALSVKVDWASFGHSVLLFSATDSSTRTYKAKFAPGQWKSTKVSCAPEAKWLTLSADGELKKSGDASAGAVSNVQDMYAHQSGTVCEFAGTFQANKNADAQRKAIQFIALVPKPIERLVYPTKAVAMVVGEKPPPMQVKPGKLDELMPSRYEVACDDKGFLFDRMLGVGFYKGDPFLEVAENGQIILSTTHSFARQFDEMAHDGAQLLTLTLSCKVFGMFAEPTGFSPATADLKVVIKDNTCWVPESLEGTLEKLTSTGRAAAVPKDKSTCRHVCRQKASCSHVLFENATCFEVKRVPGADSWNAFAKIPDCSDTASCRLVRDSEWYKTGVYCPIGRDVVRNTIVYLKKGVTPQETLYLHQGGNCDKGEWVLQALSVNDFVQAERGYFELHGEELGCKPGELDFAQLPCSRPENITEDDTLIQPLVLDDPSTVNDTADYWLHPCECAPLAWGRDPPVDPESFQIKPPGSTKDFIPPAFELVKGEFVCPARDLLPNGIHFESDDEVMELTHCEAKCKDQETCDFFWHGTQHAANTCRLYSSCVNLVREPGLNGALMAMPRDEVCVVANPTACWATSMRRAALMSTADQDYFYWHLHTQCDMMLLMGGEGVEKCSRPTYRPPNSHRWRHKRPVPVALPHGTTIDASCWSERFSGMRGSDPRDVETLTCVGGKWFNSIDALGLGTFSCQSCFQIAASGYGPAEERSEQELYYFNRLKLSLYSTVNLAKDRKVHCIEPKEQPKADPDPVVASSDASWALSAEPPTDSRRKQYFVHDNHHTRHRFIFSDRPHHDHWRQVVSFYAFDFAHPGTQRFYVSWAGHGHWHRHWLGQGPPCCGWRYAWSFYAYPKKMPGTTKYYVSMATGPHRVKVSTKPQCCGWRDVFQFYAYPTQRAGGKSGLVAWFKSEDAAPHWKSSVGNAAATVIRGGVSTQENKGNGAVSNVRYIQGEFGTQYDFGRILFERFTVCSITRYASARMMRRLLQANSDNWLHGHWESRVGVVHMQSGWQTDPHRNLRSTDWVTVCSSPQASYVMVDGNQIGTGRKIGARPVQNLVINAGRHGRESSDFAVMEVMVWDRTLTQDEMAAASKYLMQKLSHKVSDGCTMEVVNPPELQRSYSTVWANQGPGQGEFSRSMIDQKSGDWCVGKSQVRNWNAWLQMDLKQTKLVSGVVIMPRHNADHYVFSFKVQYKYDSEGSWRTIPLRFTGLNGRSREQKKQVFFKSPVEARFIRLTQFHWTGHLCLRSAVIVCHRKLENEMGLMQSETCASDYRIESLEDSPPSARHVVFGNSVNQECLALSHAGDYDTVTHQRCEVDNAQQLIPAGEIPALFSRLHGSPTAEVRLAQGLKGNFFFGFKELKKRRCDFPSIEFKQPSYTKVDAKLDYNPAPRWHNLRENDWFVSDWTGFLLIKKKGTYRFWLNADDSARLILDGKIIAHVRNCGPMTNGRSSTGTKVLASGLIALRVQHTEANGHAGIRLEYSGPDSEGKREVIPASAFAHVDDSIVDDDSRRGCLGNTAISAISGLAFAAPASGSIGVKCSFAAVIVDGEVQKRPTTRHKGGSWPEWWEDLEQISVECGPGQVLKNMEPFFVNNMQQIRFTCGVVAGLGACLPAWTDQMDVRVFQNSGYSRKVLQRLKMGCGSDSLLTSMHFEYSIGGRWTRFKYTCCKSGGAPTVVEARGLDPAMFESLEGRYCPASRGESGRYNYVQQPFAPWQKVNTPATLTFDNVAGKWCIGLQCEEMGTPAADPVGVHLPALDVAPVSDFNGQFEPMGVGASGMGIDGKLDEASKLKRKPAPKRPRPPPKPKLETFEPEMPRYSDKCVGYGDLWKKISETVTDEAGEQEQEVKELDTEKEEDGGYKDTHPCDVAGSAGGTNGRIGGGDGGSTRDQMPYDELDGCHTRDINRALVDAKADIFAARFEQGFGMAKEIADLVCTIVPNTEIAPFGIGVAIKPGEICTQAKDLGIKLTERVTPFIGLMEAEKKFKMGEEDWADCNPLQTNFARLFCDVHCVRDAVIRGDRSIVRNLKRATDITNRNMDALSTWIVKSARVDAGWLGDMVKWVGDSNWMALEAIMKKLGIGEDKKLLLSVKHHLGQMRDELSELAQQSSSSTVSAATARSALEDFNSRAGAEEHGQNQTAMLDAFLTLSATLQSTASGHSRTEALGRQVERGAQQMQQVARMQSLALGEYRRYSNVSRGLMMNMAGQGRERHAMLIALDRIWWELRDGFDDYLDSAQEEAISFEGAFSAMTQYEHCSVDFASLITTYKETMGVTDRAHRKLKNTWRRSTNLIGELVSAIDDGEAFVTFLREDGCTSALAKQTLTQVRLALGGMKMLIHRFRAAGLPQPDMQTLLQSMVRIQQSYREAVRATKCTSLEAEGADILPLLKA
eukprot:TRINITY_DN2201_c0_g1_i2.p1 TRINITY_DN2201_c0_g1~~TRINITY_DN2201_c0_g1_i2.p1  ORF type:complete len:2702 (-),score=420.67 TRINITY_DN2201_c0_g1_i2:73-8100(-)